MDSLWVRSSYEFQSLWGWMAATSWTTLVLLCYNLLHNIAFHTILSESQKLGYRLYLLT